MKLTLILAFIFVHFITVAEDQVWTLAKHLEVAGQVDIGRMAKTNGEAYRFIWHDPGLTSSKIVLFTIDGERVTMNACDVSLHEYYSSNGKAGVERKQKVLSAEEWRRISGGLSKMDFWHYQVKVMPLGLDGEFMVLEGAKNGVVKQIEEWSPERGRYKELCLSMWRISGLFMGHYETLNKAQEASERKER